MHSFTKNVLLAGLFLGAAISAVAAPPSKRVYTSAAMTADQIEQLQPGDKVAMVCKECDSVTVQTIEHKEHAMELCKEGATVVCPSCQMKLKVVRHGPRSKGGQRATVSYVNDKGEECMFVARLEK